MKTGSTDAEHSDVAKVDVGNDSAPTRRCLHIAIMQAGSNQHVLDEHVVYTTTSLAADAKSVPVRDDAIAHRDVHRRSVHQAAAIIHSGLDRNIVVASLENAILYEDVAR